MSPRSVIRTPDQRLRVFVSSTLGEMAGERAATRQAIERLRLTPVMFELGARPHPPRELYRAYLDQSHVFLGIYWQRYGWTAPGETISGLEDEYRLVGDRPRLVYIKEPAPEREARLSALLDDIKDDDRVSYKRFSTAEELGELVENDLALLLSERFETVGGSDDPPDASRTRLPVPVTETFGRTDDITAVIDLLRNGARLVTLTGPGGIGKTRLALEVAQRMRDEYPGGVYFVPLTSVADADRALRTVADHLGVRIEGSRSITELLVEHLRGPARLLVLDNLEQITGLGPALSGLLALAADVQVLATSRQALRVRAELDVPVGPLPVPDPGARLDLEQVTEEPAVQLFTDRAVAVSPGFAVTEDNARAIVELCRRLDGLPLALELAAARVRILPPGELLERIAGRLDLLSGGAGDLPDRQRTLRATIDWSYDLLEPSERILLARLSVFAQTWSLDAAQAVCSDAPRGQDAIADGAADADLLDTLASLLDKSLIASRADVADPVPRFQMLETIRVYAAERLEERGEGETLACQLRHLEWYRRFADEAQPFLCGPGQREWVARCDAERANLRLAATTALSVGDDVAVVELAWDVAVFYFVRDAVDEPDSWLRQVSEAGRPLDDVTAAKLHALYALTRIHHGDYEQVDRLLTRSLTVFRAHRMDFEAAVALHQLGFVRYALDGDPDAAVAALEESSRLFEQVNHDWGVGQVQSMLGSVLSATGDLEEAERCQLRSLERAQRIDNDPQIVQALDHLALIRLLADESDDALALLEQSVELVARGRSRTDAASCLDALASVAIARGDPSTAAMAVTTAAATREHLGIAPWPTLQVFIEKVFREARRRLGPDAFDALASEATDRGVFDALQETMEAVRQAGASVSSASREAVSGG